MTAPGQVYGYAHRGTITGPSELAGYWMVRVTAINPARPIGPYPSTVPEHAIGDRVLLTQIGTSRDDLVITGKLPPTPWASHLPISIDDVTGLQGALDGRATDAELAALASSTDSRLDTLEASDTAQGGRLTAVEGVNTTQNTRLTAVEGVNTTQDGRLTAVEGVNTTQNGRLDAVEALNTTQNTRLTNVETDVAAQVVRINALIRGYAAPAQTGSGSLASAAQATIMTVSIPAPGWPYYIVASGAIGWAMTAATQPGNLLEGSITIDSTTYNTNRLIGGRSVSHSLGAGFSQPTLIVPGQRSDAFAAFTLATTVRLIARNSGAAAMTIPAAGADTALHVRIVPA